MKKLLLGNEAVARGLYEAGCRIVSSYPGTPSTEITECAAKYDEIYAEWAPNEKVAMEVAVGASIGGAPLLLRHEARGPQRGRRPAVHRFLRRRQRRSGHLPWPTIPGMHSSQNEQDSRHYAVAAKVPMLEPADSADVPGLRQAGLRAFRGLRHPGDAAHCPPAFPTPRAWWKPASGWSRP